MPTIITMITITITTIIGSIGPGLFSVSGCSCDVGSNGSITAKISGAGKEQ